MAFKTTSARAFAAVALLSLIGDGKLTPAEIEDASERAVALRDAFNAEAQKQGITDEQTLALGKRLLGPALKTKPDIAKACRFALRCAVQQLEAIDAISDETPPADGEGDAIV